MSRQPPPDLIDVPPRPPEPDQAKPRGSWLIVIIGLGLVVGAYLYNMRTAPAAFAWRDDFDAALAEAKQEGVPVLLEFHTAGCSACRWMDRNVFSESRVAKELNGWVPVHIDGERQLKLSNRYEIEGYPTVLALTPEGDVIARRAGTMPADEFVHFLKQAATRFAEKSSAEQSPPPPA